MNVCKARVVRVLIVSTLGALSNAFVRQSMWREEHLNSDVIERQLTYLANLISTALKMPGVLTAPVVANPVIK